MDVTISAHESRCHHLLALSMSATGMHLYNYSCDSTTLHNTAVRSLLPYTPTTRPCAAASNSRHASCSAPVGPAARTAVDTVCMATGAHCSLDLLQAAEEAGEPVVRRDALHQPPHVRAGAREDAREAAGAVEEDARHRARLDARGHRLPPTAPPDSSGQRRGSTTSKGESRWGPPFRVWSQLFQLFSCQGPYRSWLRRS